MANKQIYELSNVGNDLDNSALLAMDIPNPDSSAASEIPYVTRKASINVLENQFLGEDEYTTELNTENQTIFGSINEVLTYAKNIAEEYDDTATYAVGDFVTYEGVLYKCIVAIAVAESWDSTHWDSTLIVEEFGQGGGGASVTLGTTPPSDASGSNGDLYVQYDGVSYAAVYAYVKINGSWRKFPYSKVVALTQAEYDLITPDPTTLYIITDAQSSYATKAELATGLATKQDTLTVEDISSGITFTSLENMTDVSVISAYKYGKIVDIFLQPEFTGGAVGINHRCYINFTDNNNRPKSLASTSMFQGTVFFNANLESSGLITIRDFGSSGSLTPYMRFIYICN